MTSGHEIEAFHLENAPIVEALIEIRLLEPLPPSALLALESCAAGLSESYPAKEEIVSLVQQFQFQMGHKPSGSSESSIAGFLCKDSAAHRVVHLKLDGFALSELKPYTSWDGFYPEAKRLWEAYRNAVGGQAAGSWTIRYINQISWPVGERMEDYLKVYASLPAELPSPSGGYFLRLQSAMVRPSEGLFTQQIFQIPATQIGVVSFIVDHSFLFSAIGISDAVLWERIREAREVKNEVFKATLTEHALGAYR